MMPASGMSRSSSETSSASTSRSAAVTSVRSSLRSAFTCRKCRSATAPARTAIASSSARDGSDTVIQDGTQRRRWTVRGEQSGAAVSVRQPSVAAALEVALAEQVRVELLVELHVGELDHGVRPRRRRRRLEVVRDRDRTDGAHVGLLDALLRLAPVLPQLELPRDEVVVPEP